MNKEEVYKIINEKIKEETLLMVCKKIINNLSFYNSTYPPAIVYLAYKKIKNPMPISFISQLFEIEVKYILKTYKKIKKQLNMKQCKISSTFGMKCVQIFTPKQYVENIAKKLNLSNNIMNTAISYLEKIETGNGRNPTIVAGASIYLACLFCNNQKTQREIAYVTGCTETAIRSNVKLFIKKITLDENKNG